MAAGFALQSYYACPHSSSSPPMNGTECLGWDGMNGQGGECHYAYTTAVLIILLDPPFFCVFRAIALTWT